MIKRLLPLLVGLSIGGVALAQNMPASNQPTAANAQQTASRWRMQQPAGALSESKIKTAIANTGYKEVKDLKFKDGVWRCEARGGNKNWVKLAIGPVSGKVYPADAPSKLNKNEVKAKLAAAGYQNVSDVDFDDGLWSADARTRHGHKVDLLVDPNDGSVVAKSSD